MYEHSTAHQKSIRVADPAYVQEANCQSKGIVGIFKCYLCVADLATVMDGSADDDLR